MKKERRRKICERLKIMENNIEKLCIWFLALTVPVLGLDSFCSRKVGPWLWPRIFLVLTIGLGLEGYVLYPTFDRDCHHAHATRLSKQAQQQTKTNILFTV